MSSPAARASLSDDYHAYNYLDWAPGRHEVPKNGDKLVVQLISPQTARGNSLPDPKYSHATLVDRCHHQQPPGSLFQPSLDYSYTNCAFSSGISEETLNSTSLEQGSLRDDPPSSSPEHKRDMFRSYLTVISSCIYAVFIVTLGVVIYISDIVLGHTPLAESFSIYLVMVGLIYLLFLYIDIRRCVGEVKERKAALRMGDSDNSLHVTKGRNGDLHAWGPESVSTSEPSSWTTESPMMLDYCFSTGRHSGSFYLKCGAAGFCFGHLIHSGLLMGYQIVFLTAENDHDFYGCASVPTLVLDIIYPLYSFFQLFFIFKYSNVIINRCKELARFALMHCIASSICFWVWTILRETMDSLHHYAAAKDKMASKQLSLEETVESLESIMALPLVSYKQRGAEELLRFLNDSSKLTNQCLEPNGLTLISENFSPYLYPFTIEYSILVVGILFIIWQNIGSCCAGDTALGRHCGCTVAESEESNMVIHADCHSANKGLFAGLMVLVGSVVSIIIFCVAMADSQYIDLGLTVNVTSELALLVLMTVTVVFAYRQVTQLDVNLHPISLLDDLLLFICIPAFFLYAIFSIVPAVERSNYLAITRILLQVIQVLLQTPFIIDGLRRCSNSRALRLEKPGRELVTFLIVCNVAMWVTETFEIKSHEVEDDRYDVYGKVLWTIVSHMTVPLTMFYRFHSSVCLADMWKSAYERGQ